MYKSDRMVSELAPKPSDAIKAMIAGLRELPSDQFRIDMGTFGHSRKGVCFGCAATCAVYRLMHSRPEPVSISGGIFGQAGWFKLDYDALYNFELAMDRFRSGRPADLFRFYGYVSSDVPAELLLSQWWSLETVDWHWQLPKIDRYVAQLVAAGF